MTRIVAFDPAPGDDRERFVALPYGHYAGDPEFVPPFKAQVRSQLDARANPFFRYGHGRCFLAVDGGTVEGRIAAFRNPGMDRGGERLGAVGYFESVKDYAVARVLLDAASEWLAKAGCTRVVGPMNYSIWNSYRFKVNGFGSGPVYGAPHNKPFYPEQFERYGFAATRTWHNWRYDMRDPEVRRALEARCTAIEERRDDRDGGRYRIAFNDPRRFHEELQAIHGLAMEAFAAHAGYYRIDFQEFGYLFGGLRALLRKGQILYLMEGERRQGFAVHYHNVARAIQTMRGESHWLARLKFLAHRNADEVVQAFGALAPEKFGLGLAGLLFAASARRHFLAPPTRFAYGLLVYDGNKPEFYARGIAEAISIYRLYDKAI